MEKTDKPSKKPDDSKDLGDYLRDGAEFMGVLSLDKKPYMHSKMKAWKANWTGPIHYKGNTWWKHKDGSQHLEAYYMFWKYRKNAGYMTKDIAKTEAKIEKKKASISKLEEKYAGKMARLEFLSDELERLEGNGVLPGDTSYILINYHLEKLEKQVGSTGASTSNGKIPKLEKELDGLRQKLAKYEENLSRSRRHMFYWKSAQSPKKKK